ncbi:hypothetical protein WJR50_29165 [Catalinimonas sp. 4WD22]|uniref:hypothetical protein n=1 Tax=Catalinimonas locisalis TaxID=3133978 RepID=UPI00310156B0
MKFIIFLVLILIPTHGLLAQISVSDHLLQDEIAEQLNHDTKQAAILGLIQQLTEQSLDTVSATHQLQALYQEFLKQTASTAQFRVSELDEERDNALQIIQASSQLTGYSFANNLAEIYHAQLEPAQKSQLLYEELIPYDESLMLTEPSSFDVDQKQRKLNQLALKEMSDKRKLLLAKTYQDLAESKLKNAQELQLLLQRDEVFSMTEQQRLKTIKRMQEYFQSSSKLKTKADQWVQKAASNSFSKAYSVQVFEHQLERKILEKSTLFQP